MIPAATGSESSRCGKVHGTAVMYPERSVATVAGIMTAEYAKHPNRLDSYNPGLTVSGQVTAESLASAIAERLRRGGRHPGAAGCS
jgi:hypothetical protein